MMYWYGSGMSGWGYVIMIVSMVLFWGALIAGAVALFRYLGRSPATPVTGQPTPEQILAARFARGEIDGADYQERLNALHSGP